MMLADAEGIETDLVGKSDLRSNNLLSRSAGSGAMLVSGLGTMVAKLSRPSCMEETPVHLCTCETRSSMCRSKDSFELKNFGFVQLRKSLGKADGDSRTLNAQNAVRGLAKTIRRRIVAETVPWIDSPDIFNTHSSVVVYALLDFSHRVGARKYLNADQRRFAQNEIGGIIETNDRDVGYGESALNAYLQTLLRQSANSPGIAVEPKI